VENTAAENASYTTRCRRTPHNQPDVRQCTSRPIETLVGKPFFLSEIQNALQRFAAPRHVESDASRGGFSVPQGGICDPNNVVDTAGADHAVSDAIEPKAISSDQLRTPDGNSGRSGMPFAKWFAVR
jgi:hypothetical protein